MEHAPKLLAAVLTALFLGICALVALTTLTNMADTYGFAGVVGPKARGLALSCGGTYNPQEMVVFHPTFPCGATLTVINPVTGQAARGTVVHQKVMYRASDRVADISPALAQAIGLNPATLAAPRVVIRQKLAWLPVIPHLLKDLGFKTTAGLDKADFQALTNNLLGECATCGELGMTAVAQVTQNRASMAYNGQTTLHAVVYAPKQFSWVHLNPRLESAQPRRKQAQQLAALFMLERLSGNALAVQYKVGQNATHYYAFRLIKAPAWARNGAKLKQVRLSAALEGELHHRFYATPALHLASR